MTTLPGPRGTSFQAAARASTGKAPRRICTVVLLTAISWMLPFASAQNGDEILISPLNPLDRQYMDAQRQYITELTLRHYGGRCCRSSSELDYLQRLLDDGIVTGNDREALQAMGILLGDLLATELDLQWVVYEDRQGRSRALRLDETDNYLFPVTMISRRREADDRTPVEAIYRKAVDDLEAVRPPLPFQ